MRLKPVLLLLLCGTALASHRPPSPKPPSPPHSPLSPPPPEPPSPPPPEPPAPPACLPSCNADFASTAPGMTVFVGPIVTCFNKCVASTSLGPTLLNVTRFCQKFPYCIQCGGFSDGTTDTSTGNGEGTLLHIVCASVGALAPALGTSVVLATQGASVYGNGSFALSGSCAIVPRDEARISLC